MKALDAGEATLFPNGSRQVFDSKVEVVTREERLKNTFFELSSCAFTLRDLPWLLLGIEWQAVPSQNSQNAIRRQCL